jgi:hypothetical protein
MKNLGQKFLSDHHVLLWQKEKEEVQRVQIRTKELKNRKNILRQENENCTYMQIR